ncbi:hypothetical protein GCM10009845_18320 [Pedococcus bigeumensis]
MDERIDVAEVGDGCRDPGCGSGVTEVHAAPVEPGLSRADHVYVLAHGAKLGDAPFHAWAVMPARWTLVTDDSATPEQIRPFEAAGVEVVVVEVTQDDRQDTGA